MADEKLTALTALDAFATGDLLYVVDDPAGTPVSKKATIDQAKTFIVGAGSVSIASGKTLTGSNTLTLAGTAGTTMTFPATSATLARTDAGNTFTGNQTLGSSDNLNWNSDTILTRRGAANLRLGAADTSASATVTITIAAPGVVTWSSHGLTTGSPVVFSTTGALPTGITAGTTYYAVVVDANSFQFATSFANAIAATPTVVTTSGSQSGTQTARRGAIAQQFGVQDVLSTSSLENIDGADFVIRGSRSIGNKPGGSLIFQVAPAGSSGTAQNALATALTISGGSAFLTTNAFSITNTISTLRAFSSGSGGGIVFANSGANSEVGIVAGNTMQFTVGGNGVTYVSQLSIGVMTGYRPTADTLLVRDLAATLALRNANNGQTFRVYGRFTDITNDFERFFITAPTTSGAAVQLGTQKGATTGAARALELQTDATSRLALDTVGSAQIVTALTVATLPGTPLTGMMARVTDALAPVVGVTVAAGGAAQALCWYNGANWTVIGV